MANNKFSKFFIRGLHCPSCEILIEKKLRKIDGIFDADVSLSQQTLRLEHAASFKISPDYLDGLFVDDHYTFSHSKIESKNQKVVDCPIPQDSNPLTSNPMFPYFVGGLLIIAFILFNQTGLSGLVSISSQSALPAFFLFGLLAGFSSCAALVGGIILSLSKQWNSNYSPSDSFFHRSQPHFLFNLGRIAGYTFFGSLLGVIGNFFRFSPVVTAIMVIAVSVLMVLLSLQMLGVKALANFQIRLPKALTGKIADESNFQGRFAPALMGALTFFLPCGFTITAQAIALASGNSLTGGLIMGLFALGTAPGLLAIGLSSVKFHGNTSTSKQFSMVAGILVLFFALFNISSQLNVLGVGLPSGIQSQESSIQNDLPSIVNGKQVIRMTATSGGYTPNQFTVKVGIPVSWQISNDGRAGCGSSIVARGLFSDRIDTIPGQIVTKEFTPTTPGTYRFSCSMGMYTGTIVVVDGSGAAVPSNAPVIGSGSQGCPMMRQQY